MKVLLVDDDSIHLMILKRIFEQHFADVCVAKNGKEALRILEFDSSFQVILTDIIMPEMDGIELVSYIKESRHISQIPVIGFTSGDLEKFRKEVSDDFHHLVSKTQDFYQLVDLARLAVA